MYFFIGGWSVLFVAGLQRKKAMPVLLGSFCYPAMLSNAMNTLRNMYSCSLLHAADYDGARRKGSFERLEGS